MAQRLLFLGLLLLCLSGGARAGEMRPCTDPTVFEGAALNALILPYRVDGPPPSQALQAASRQISALVHLEVLMGLLKYGSVGAKDLLAVPGRVCDVEQVLAQVTQAGGRGALRQGQVLLLVWGRLFEQQGELYVQSYLRFLRQGRSGPEPELLNFSVQKEQSRLVLAAGLPSQALAFSPRRISRAELARVDSEFRQAMVLRERPEANAPGRSINFSPDSSFPYWVADARGDWMLIKPMQGGPAGWVRVRGQGEDGDAPWSLRRWLPELAYVDAVAASCACAQPARCRRPSSSGRSAPSRTGCCATRPQCRPIWRRRPGVSAMPCAAGWPGSVASAARRWSDSRRPRP
jgi:hypothetical protein